MSVLTSETTSPKPWNSNHVCKWPPNDPFGPKWIRSLTVN